MHGDLTVPSATFTRWLWSYTNREISLGWKRRGEASSKWSERLSVKSLFWSLFLRRSIDGSSGVRIHGGTLGRPLEWVLRYLSWESCLKDFAEYKRCCTSW